MIFAQQTTVNCQVVLFAAILSLSCLINAVAAASLDSRNAAPAPISIPPSQEFDGDDGPWSTFTVQIGNPPQSVKVLISTYSHQTWAIAEEGCQSGDPTDCNKLRGGLYNYSASSSWVPNTANLTTLIYGLGLESNLGYSGNGRYGFDDVTLGFQGSSGPSLKNQTVAGVATEDFFLGLFGLNPAPSNFTDFDDPIPSFMENLRKQSMIPSTSWAYFAGNQYRSSEVLGSLTLGGYDTSKFIANNLTFNFSTNDQPDLAVQISSITALNTSSSSSSTSPVTLLSIPITTYLDSTIPYMYFPLSVCSLIETTFGLTYNTTTQLYTISTIQHTLLLAQNPNITFTLTRPDLLGSPITLIFPYLAFALQATWPLVDTPTLYFPIKRANDSSQYRLGRAFFQEAYIIADYERRNFSVSQARYDIPTQNIIAISAPGNSTITVTSTKKSGLPIGAIVGIAAGGTAVLISLLSLVYFCIWKPKHHRTKAAEFSARPLTLQSSYPNTPTTEYFKPELETTTPKPRYEFDADNSPKFPNAPQEIDSKQKRVYFELPAREEVAAEVAGSANLSSTLLAEQDEARMRKDKMNRPKKEKRRWSWDRRRRASLGERSLGLGSESTETETVTETTLSSGWGDSLRTDFPPSPLTPHSGIGNVQTVRTEKDGGEGSSEPYVNLGDFERLRLMDGRNEERRAETISSNSSGWVVSPRSVDSELR
ncbi:acid protease [Acephala macrosclerotiorum]|nr:acid protease [Acephala macrosclerotiorum]